MGFEDMGETYQCVFLPGDSFVLVGVCVAETLNLAGFAPEEAMQVGAYLVAFGLLEVVALGASCLGDICKFL